MNKMLAEEQKVRETARFLEKRCGAGSMGGVPYTAAYHAGDRVLKCAGSMEFRQDNQSLALGTGDILSLRAASSLGSFIRYTIPGMDHL